MSEEPVEQGESLMWMREGKTKLVELASRLERYWRMVERGEEIAILGRDRTKRIAVVGVGRKKVEVRGGQEHLRTTK